MIEKTGDIIFIGATYISFFFLWNLFLRFPDELTAKLVFLILCPYLTCTLVYMVYSKEEKIKEANK